MSDIVGVLYSEGHSLYCVPSLVGGFWLSVAVHSFPAPEVRKNIVYFGSVETADHQGWRSAYNRWGFTQGGDTVSLPADDPLVVDYVAAIKILEANRERGDE